jgi:hypothetical protein
MSVRNRTGFVCVVVALLISAAPTLAGARPRPRGGSNRCLSHADTHWVNDNVNDIKQYLVDLTAGAGVVLTVASGAYSTVFAHGQISVVEALELIGPADGVAVISGALDASAMASYRIRGHALVISDVTENHAVIQIFINGMPQPPQTDLATIFPDGGARVRFSCQGATLTLFNAAGAHLVLRRRALG